MVVYSASCSNRTCGSDTGSVSLASPLGGEDGILDWRGFEIPFVLRVDDNFRASPHGSIPNTSVLAREPQIEYDTEEEIGDNPIIYFDLEEAETGSFETFIKAESERLARLRSCEWSRHLIERGLGFLVKAFFGGGFEQLLWHITTIESLFGDDDGAGLTNRLAQRVSRVLGDTEAERKTVRKRFTDMYEIRSRLVHGDQIPRYVEAPVLRHAREFARQVMLWFTCWLDEIIAKAHGDFARLPERRDLLRFLDLEADSRTRIKWLAESLPSDFPRVPGWLLK